LNQLFALCLSIAFLSTSLEAPRNDSASVQAEVVLSVQSQTGEGALEGETTSMLSTAYDTSEEITDMNKLFDFTSNVGFQSWRTVDDRVMGGVSWSRMIPQEHFASFQGTLSLENNGGFASVRSPELDERLENIDSIRLKVRGDGRTYQLSIRTDRVFDGVRYRTSFDTEEGVWEEVVLSLGDFSPTRRGRRVPGTPDLRASDVRSFGLMVADKQDGQFRLDVESLSAE
jgi:NADH dehydrogenase [ubiquinone] 1 alpha subcomplex assembly factor 1